MQVFPREVTDGIAEKFRDYFRRRSGRKGMTIRDAALLIDSVAGPVSGPRDMAIADPRKPKVGGGGPARPSDDKVQAMLSKYMTVDDIADWDEVFEEVIRRYRRDEKGSQVIDLVFREGLSPGTVADEIFVCPDTYYRIRREVLLTAGVLAVEKGLISP